MNQIEDGRREIDRIDSELLLLLNRRIRLAIEIGKLKKAAGLPVFSPGREHNIVRRAVEASDSPLDRAAVEKIFHAILRESRRLEKCVAQREAVTAQTRFRLGSEVRKEESYR